MKNITATAIFYALTMALIFYTVCVLVSCIISWAFDWAWTMKTPIGYAVAIIIARAIVQGGKK